MDALTNLLTILLGGACLYVSQFARHHSMRQLRAQSYLAGAAGLMGVAAGCFGLRGNAMAASTADALFRLLLLCSVWRFHAWGEVIYHKRPRQREREVREVHDH